MAEYNTTTLSVSTTSFNQSSFGDTRKPVYYEPAFTIFMACIAFVASLVTITGNVIVLISFILEKSIRQPSNYFIASLAVSDFFIGAISIPFYAAYLLAGHYWLLGEILCDLWLSIDYSACLCSIYTVFCITIDRYCSVKIPATYRAWKTGTKILVIIAVIWTIPVVVFFTSIFGWQYITGKRDLEVGECDVQYMKNAVFNSVLQIGYFWVTLVLMIALYASIYRVVLRLQKKSEKKRKKIARLVATASSAKPLKPQSTMLMEESTHTHTEHGKPDKEHLSLCPLHSEPERFRKSNTGILQNNDTVGKHLLKKSISLCDKNRQEKYADEKNLNEKNNFEGNEKSRNKEFFRENNAETKVEEIDEYKNAVKEIVDQQQCPLRLYSLDDSNDAKNSCLQNLHLCRSKQSDNTLECENAFEKECKNTSNKNFDNGDRVSETENNLKLKIKSENTKLICKNDAKEIFSKSNTTETLLCTSLAADLENVRQDTAKYNIKSGSNLILKSEIDEMQSFKKCEDAMNASRSETSSKDLHVINSGQQSLFPKKKSILFLKNKNSLKFTNKLKNTEKELQIRNRIKSQSDKSSRKEGKDLERVEDDNKEDLSSEKGSKKIIQATNLEALRNNFCCCNRQRERQQTTPTCITGTTTTTTSAKDADDSDPAQRFTKQPSRREDRAFKALRTITLILGAFVLCWTPWHLLSFVMGFCPRCVNSTLYDISYWACYINSPINPLCYAFANHQFKKTFIRIVKLDWHRT